ncbi:MAG: glycosyltransferase involved in cell wall biosynthesis [Arenicella sp.]|jgi:glycosyltransferase involved in cell wall biosynthesis
MIDVYYDVENTLELPFITGIQRVVREFSKQVLLANDLAFTHTYTPIVYDHKKQCWRKLSGNEKSNLLSAKPRSINLVKRVLRKIGSYIPKSKALYITNFTEGSIFLDIESSWHSKLKREDLLPSLKQANVRLAKLHYDIIPLLFPDTSHPNTINVFNDHFLSHLRYSELFICISKRTKFDVSAYCQQNSVPEPILETIVLGSDIRSSSRLVKRKEKLKSEYGRYLLSVGTLEPRKNYLMLIKAFDAISLNTDLSLVIVGKLGWLSENILNVIEQHPQNGKRLFHLSNVSDNQLDHLYRSAWLTIVPSLYEGFGLPVVESLARRCPTICSRAGSLPEVGGDDVLLFSEDSPDELFEMINVLNNNDDKYQSLRQKAQQYKPDNWQTTALQIDQILTDNIL